MSLGAWTTAEGGGTSSTCRPLGHDKAALLELRSRGFAIEDEQERQRFAIELLDCLGDPDPEIRDKVGYEAYATLLRGGQLDPDTVRHLRMALIERLTATQSDDAGFTRPFAALVLSEVARADRVDPLFSAGERTGLVDAATAYMRSVDDYRGFDQKQGWRHAVAHAADLLMQLALNPALDRDQLAQIRDAVATQVAPAGAHFYVYGESERLARPILFIALRGEFTDEEWAGWFGGIGSPAPFDSWSDVYGSQAGLAKLHNTKGFAQVIYVNASASDKVELAPLASAALSVLRNLP